MEVSNVGTSTNSTDRVGRAAVGSLTKRTWDYAPRLITRLRPIALRSLKRMYAPDEKLFLFRLRLQDGAILREGLSPRYTAMTLIGLADEDDTVRASIFGEPSLHDVRQRLQQETARSRNLGDVAVIAWAMHAIGQADCAWAWNKLVELRPAEPGHFTVEVAWALAALCMNVEAGPANLRQEIARNLLSSFNSRTGIFPHVVEQSRKGLRSHVACFADQVYPIHALSHYFRISGDQAALLAANKCALQICRVQGDSGQWWWHYDTRTGAVVEGYPVYAIHQDAMGPMALRALREAGGADFSRELEKGLEWLEHSPELAGGSLIDEQADLVWRKVARREPGKLSRGLQAIASRLHSSLRVPGTDLAFPATAVDHEDRPYHLGWLLYAWRGQWSSTRADH